MTEARERPSSRASSSSSLPRFPRVSDLFDINEEMITWVEKYQKVWESESRATLALGEFLAMRAESMRYQVEMMRMGSDAFKRYTSWSEALLSLRPDTFMQALLRSTEPRSRASRAREAPDTPETVDD